MTRNIVFFMCLIILVSCAKESKNEVDVSGIEVELKVDRFEQEFYKSSISELSDLKQKYSVFFPENVPDSIWVERMNNDEELYLLEDSDSIFGDFEEEKVQLISLFKHIKHHYPNFKEPKIATYISDLDFEFPVIYADSLMFVALDMYLGKDNIVYKDFPKYLSQNYNKENLPVDIAQVIVNKVYPKARNRQFLAKIIEEGKRKYLVDIFLPEVQDYLKMGYSKEKMEWAELNEINIWKYFMGKELLYSNEPNLDARFIDVAPFSKFYQEADQDSPGQIGVWLGWQIVDSFMQNNDVTLQQLMSMDPEELFKRSKYKPRKH